MGFDDHEESYVTLNNRNFSKMILDQLGNTEKQIEGIIITPNDFNVPKQLSILEDVEDKNFFTESPRKYRSQRINSLKSLNPGNYEKLSMTLYDIIFEKAETGSNKNFLNFKGKNLVLDQKLDEV